MSKREEYPSTTHRIMTGCGNMFVHILYTDKQERSIHAIKATLGKSGGCARSHLESKVALVNAIITNIPNEIAIKTLTDACGHTCNEEYTCHDLLLRLVIEELMKKKI